MKEKADNENDSEFEFSVRQVEDHVRKGNFLCTSFGGLMPDFLGNKKVGRGGVTGEGM